MKPAPTKTHRALQLEHLPARSDPPLHRRVDVSKRLEHADEVLIDRQMQPLFRNVSDHIRCVQEDIGSLREVLAFAFEASLMAGQAQQNAITRRLAARGPPFWPSRPRWPGFTA